MPRISAENLEAHRAETTDRLLDAWSGLVLERGYDGVSLADVAKRIGLARTAVYNYFADREELLFAWTDREVKRTLDLLQRRLTELDTAVEKLHEFVVIELESFEASHLPQGQEVVHFLGADVWQRFMEHVQPVEAILRDILDEGVATGEFEDAPVDQTLPMVMACIGAERGPLAAGKASVEEATERVMSFLERALVTRDGRPRRRGR
jgi:AcrR family transcriptional regulator